MSKKTFFKDTWESVEILGKGSFGTVYKAKKANDEIENYSAIKEITIPSDIEIVKTLTTEGLSTKDIDEELLDIKTKFINEIKVMYDLKNSENIVRIEDFEELEEDIDDPNYSKKYTVNIRMELLSSIDGFFLQEDVTDKDVLKMAIDITKALRECHGHKIIHRDVKPENIFVNKKGIYKLGDFGEAKNLNKTISNLSKKGTENYMSPEIYKGEKADYTSDIYSLGIVLYRFFNNKKLPFLPQTNRRIPSSIREEAIYKRISGEDLPKPVNASNEIADIILKMCAYKKEKRYRDFDELLSDLESVYEKLKKKKNIFTEIIEDEGNKTISLYGSHKKTMVEVVEVSKEELEKGTTKTITIDDKEYEVVIPANSEDEDEIVLEAETVKDGKKEKVALLVMLSLIPSVIPTVVGGGEIIDKGIKTKPIKKVYTPNRKGLVIKFTKDKIVVFSLLAIGIVASIIFMNIPKDNKTTKKVSKEEKQTAKILTCIEEEQETTHPQNFKYKFYFDKTNNTIEKIEFNGEYPPLGGVEDPNLVNHVSNIIKENFCAEEALVVPNTCDIKTEGFKIYSSYEIVPEGFLGTYGYTKDGFVIEKGKTLLEVIKDDYENRDLDGCFEIFTISTQACGEIFKTTCTVEEVK